MAADLKELPNPDSLEALPLPSFNYWRRRDDMDDTFNMLQISLMSVSRIFLPAAKAGTRLKVVGFPKAGVKT